MNVRKLIGLNAVVLAAWTTGSFLPTVAAAEADLIRNGGFENVNAKSGLPENWIAVTAGDAGATRLAVSSDSFSGERALKIVGLVEKPNNGVMQTIEAGGRRTFVLRCRVKTEGAGAGFASVWPLDGAGKEIRKFQYSRTFHREVDWKLLTWQFTVPAEAVRFTLVLRACQGPGAVCYDDVSLVDLAEIKQDSLPAGAKLVLTEDFSSAKLDARWRIIHGKWELKHGALMATGPNAVIVFSQPLGRNLRVEYTAWAAETPCDLSALLSLDPNSKDIRRSGYIFGFGSQNNTLNNIVRGPEVKQLARTMLENYSSGIKPGKKHRVVAQRNGDSLRLYVDGELSVQADDSLAADIEGGCFGFSIWNQGYIDDVKVYVFPEAQAGEARSQVPVEFSAHEGFDDGETLNTPTGLKLQLGPSCAAEVVDEPTWVYGPRAEHFVKDLCLRVRCEGAAGWAVLRKPFNGLASGIVEFDIRAEQWQGEGLRVALADADGKPAFTLVIDGEGRFSAETEKGSQPLLDMIEYRRRGGATARFRFQPEPWRTLRIAFDASAGLVRSIGVLNLYTEFASYDHNDTDQGDYLVLGAGLPMKTKVNSISQILFSARGQQTFRLDNLSILGPVGRRSVNGKSILKPVRELLGLPFPPRKDPLRLNLYSLRNVAAVPPGARPGYLYNSWGAGNSFATIKDANSPEYGPFTGASDRYNDLLVRQAFAEENRLMLQRAAYYLGVSGRSSAETARRLGAVVAAEQETLDRLEEAYQAYGHAFLDNLNVGRLAADFAGRADRLEESLHRFDAVAKDCWARMPADAVDAAGKEQPCPAPMPRTPLVWKNRQYLRDGEPDFFYYRWDVSAAHLRSMRYDAYTSTRGPWVSGLKAGEYLKLAKTDEDRAEARTRFKEECKPFSQYGYFFRTVTWDNFYRVAVPGWWLAANKADRDVFFCKENGEPIEAPYSINGDWAYAYLNTWNPKVRDYLRHHFDAVAQWVRDVGPEHVVAYCCSTEWQNVVAGGYETGHNPSAIVQFRAELQDTYKTIAAVNRHWGTAYRGFDEIVPPQQRSPPSGLQYEFQRFRHRGYKECMDYAQRPLKQRYPDVPNFYDCMAFMGSDGVDSFDMTAYFAMSDIVSYHTFVLRPRKAANRWLDSLRKAYKNTLGNREWGAEMTCPEMFDETIYKRSGLAQMFHMMMWGQGVLELMASDEREGNWTYGEAITEPRLGFTVLRSSRAGMPVGFDRNRRIGRLALKLPSVEPDVAILEVTSSYYNAYPAGALRHGMQQLAYLLEDNGFNYGTLYEPLVLDGRQRLNKIQTILVPDGICMKPELVTRLGDWVEHGGTLVCFGPAGLLDPYGVPDNRLLTRVFGAHSWEHVSYNDWELQGGKAAGRAESIGRIALHRARLGKGHVWVFGSVTDYDGMRRRTLEIVNRATDRSFRCLGNKFDLAMRADGEARYLYVLNSDLYENREDEIVVKGIFPKVVDRGLVRPWLVPRRVEDGKTSFGLRLAPAEGTLIVLRP